jgi:uncharacterized protein (TIGR00255 family)
MRDQTSMNIQSMTGFGRADGSLGSTAWHWEARSVNNRGLDLRLRLPPGYEALEPKVREGIAQRMTRGSVTVSLSVAREAAQSQMRLNEAALDEVIRTAERIRKTIDAPPPRAEGLLALRGVLEVVDQAEDEATIAATQRAMLASLSVALDDVAAARSAEGRRLAGVIQAQLAEIGRLVGLIEASPARTPQAILQRLKEQVGRLVETGQGLDPVRLHQEAVLIATRADVEEELKRLKAHLEAGGELLREPGAIGRKLDFLAQEFNREANTLTSKAADADIARLGLSLKVVVDQMREQVQNIE